MLQQMKLVSSLLVVAMLQEGCISAPPMPDDPDYAPVYTMQPKHDPVSAGSLFVANNMVTLYHDRSAHRVGDILTIVLNERTIAKKSSATAIRKENTSDIAEPVILTNLIQGLSVNKGLLNGMQSENDFSGTANSDQSNSLQGSISVSVVDVFANGILVVRGEKWLSLNQGDEFIRISGLIRPEDLGADNTIDSSKVANARISYGGRGVLADANSLGWFSRFFINPLFPY